jgi:hypothetical protein
MQDTQVDNPGTKPMDKCSSTIPTSNKHVHNIAHRSMCCTKHMHTAAMQKHRLRKVLHSLHDTKMIALINLIARLQQLLSGDACSNIAEQPDK